MIPGYEGTPGPLYAVDYAGFIQLHTVPSYGNKDLLNCEECPEAVANGQLFAAAPDLLQALYSLVQAIEFGVPHIDTGYAKEAINKALNTQP